VPVPRTVQDVVGYALFLAQSGGQHPAAKRLKGDLQGLMEVVEDHASGTYRAVYAAKLAKTIYVLHVFRKKATRGIATPNASWISSRRVCVGLSSRPAAPRRSDS
jgi:phage-related protein